MVTCGMYDYSGEFFFKVGIPAKSGVGGWTSYRHSKCYGYLCLVSTALDKNGNSVKGIEFCKELVKNYAFHNYDGAFAKRDSQKHDPRRNIKQEKGDTTTSLIFSAFNGDIEAVQRHLINGVDINKGDYDGRTALPRASAEGHLELC